MFIAEKEDETGVKVEFNYREFRAIRRILDCYTVGSQLLPDVEQAYIKGISDKMFKIEA